MHRHSRDVVSVNLNSLSRDLQAAETNRLGAGIQERRRELAELLVVHPLPDPPCS